MKQMGRDLPVGSLSVCCGFLKRDRVSSLRNGWGRARNVNIRTNLSPALSTLGAYMT